ncbi:MAG TPA: Rap1a/Tai family immunity protein [Caulobacteraceae bacterium]|nr:Rap1a/Tai family immunity protein [Caulobacteraceae bacterium]
MTRFRAIILATVPAIGLLAAPAAAADLEFFTGQSLYAQCSAKPADADFATRNALCTGYVVGISDAQQAAQGMGGPQRVCFPAGVTAAQMVVAVTAFLDAHPEKRPLAAQDLVVEALSAQSPCK